MRPPRRSQTDFERINAYDEWIPGVIQEIKLEEQRRTGFKDETTGADKYADCVRFKFALNGHQFPHYSRWMTYSFGEKANLYIKYLKQLVANAEPDMEFDLDNLQGMKIKTMWSENGDFDNLEQIRPFGAKFPRSPEKITPGKKAAPQPLKSGTLEPSDEPPVETIEDSVVVDDIPF